MIRRWSCLIDLNNNFNSYDFFKKNHKLNLFKNSVNFKRYNIKNTKFKRKSLIRLKHRSNWLIYTNVIKFWIKDYIFNKNYLRYQYFNKILLNNFFFYNFNFIKNRNDTFFSNFNFFFFNYTHKNNFYFTNHKLPYFKNSTLSFSWYLQNPSLNKSILPIYSEWENNLYHYSSEASTEFDLNIIFDSIFNLLIQKNIEFRKILIILYYNKISSLKKLNIFVIKNLFNEKIFFYFTSIKNLVLFL